MSDPSASQTYVFDQTQADHDRLVRLARRNNVYTREACLRAGLARGARAIDVGCGPLGALPVLAELVGPGGTVLGLDADGAALARARATLDRLELSGVELVEADVNALDQAASLGPGRFDLAHCRLLLMYQRDPAATLRQIARLVRSGGRIVALDLLSDPNFPRFYPPVPASVRIQRLFFGLVERKGGTPDMARRYGPICEQAGLRVIEQRGRFRVADDPGEELVSYRDVLVNMRSNLLAQGLASEEEINALVQEMDAARVTVTFGTGVLAVEMIAEVP
jgi:ubiquinone/menaquinone biosynthesis C-methylase UbiE